jgi:Uma2 family endonuclease
MNAPAPHRFTVRDYYRLVEMGVLQSRSPVELLDGEIFDLSPPAPVPAPHRFSVEEYYRMAETGVLKPGARVELLDGVIHDMSPIGPLHGGVVNRLIEFFVTSSGGRWMVSAQNPARLSASSEPQPDVMLLKRAPGYYTGRHPGADDVFLLIEVSDSSLAYDRGGKLAAYARSLIAEVWIVNLPERTIEVYRRPSRGAYGSKTIFRRGDRVFPQAFPDVGVDVAGLLST